MGKRLRFCRHYLQSTPSTVALATTPNGQSSLESPTCDFQKRRTKRRTRSSVLLRNCKKQRKHWTRSWLSFQKTQRLRQTLNRNFSVLWPRSMNTTEGLETTRSGQCC